MKWIGIICAPTLRSIPEHSNRSAWLRVVLINATYAWKYLMGIVLGRCGGRATPPLDNWNRWHRQRATAQLIRHAPKWNLLLELLPLLLLLLSSVTSQPWSVLFDLCMSWRLFCVPCWGVPVVAIVIMWSRFHNAFCFWLLWGISRTRSGLDHQSYLRAFCLTDLWSIFIYIHFIFVLLLFLYDF